MTGSNTFGVVILLLFAGDAQYDNCTSGRVDWIADGFCDINDVNNNIEECGYDGGDCCACTCKDTPDRSCGEESEYSCIDPNSGCTDALAIQFPNCAGAVYDNGNGKCDLSLNNEDCGYDAGDCCECTCVDGSNYSCSDNIFLCLDPGSSCVDAIAAQYANCTGDLAMFANGFCQDFNNNEGCGYDGGDCCVCTCTDGPEHLCVENDDFDCVDPDVPTTALYDCQEPPPSLLPCEANLHGRWLVENAAEANDLAEALYCTGGSFDVDWRGDIVVRKTIHVVDGTALKITGVGSSPTISGGNTTRIFTVVNASLHLIDLIVSHGKANSGGAVAASESILTLNHTIFSGNTAIMYGGALDVSGGSSVFGMNTAFQNNMAGSGGALHLTNGSSVSWAGETAFSNNAAERCGAISIKDRSSVFWVGNTTFSDNAASSHGGALQVTDYSVASWSGEMSFVGNTVSLGFGGAIYVSNEGGISWRGATKCSNNSAFLAGGCIFLKEIGSVSWSGSTDFSGNMAHGGGALYFSGKSNVSWSGETRFSHNTATGSQGGAIAVVDSTVSWSGDTIFLANIATTEGGAIYVLGSRIVWNAETIFNRNTADDGGAMLLTQGSSVEWTGKTIFSLNSASSDGGAIGFQSADSATSSVLLINGTTTFTNNTCGENGGGLAIQDMLSVEFETANVIFMANSAKVSGGAIFISGTKVGLVIQGTSFIENTAQVGGGVYATGSGTASSGDLFYPTTFHGCSFFNNKAVTAGGAVNSALGQDLFIETSFVGNQAMVGGALELAGTAYVDRCSFEDNVSGVGGGSAVSSIGSISGVNRSSFVHNVLSCDKGTFLTFSKVRTLDMLPDFTVYDLNTSMFRVPEDLGPSGLGVFRIDIHVYI